MRFLKENTPTEQIVQLLTDNLTALGNIEKRLTRMESKLHEFFDDKYKAAPEDGEPIRLTMNSADVQRWQQITNVFGDGYWSVKNAVDFCDIENAKCVHNMLTHARVTDGYKVHEIKGEGTREKLYRITYHGHQS